MRKPLIFTVLLVLFMATAVFATNTPAPKSAKTKELYDKAIALAYRGNYKDAMEQFRKVAELEPAYAPAYNGWGVCLSALGNLNEAIEKFKITIKLDPKMAKPYYNWGNVLAKMADHNGAIEKFKKASQLDPNYTPVYQSWGLSLVELGKYDEAIEKFRKISRLEPKRANDVNRIIEKVQKIKAAQPVKGMKK